MIQPPPNQPLLPFHLFKWGCVAAVSILCVLSLAMVIVTPEPFLHLIDGKSPKEFAVIEEFGKCRRLINLCVLHWEYEIPKDPPKQISEYAMVDFPDKKNQIGGNFPRYVPYLWSGIDPWGSPFIFESDIVDTGGGHCEFVVTLRSIGSNRRDELGGGDDIERVYSFFCVCSSTAKVVE